MSLLTLIIKREFIAKVRNKSFIVMTFLSPLLMVGLAAFVGYLANMKTDVKTIAVQDQTGQFVNEFENNDQYKYVNVTPIDLKILKQEVVAEHYEGILLIPNIKNTAALKNNIQYISNESPGVELISNLEQVIAKKITAENYKTQGLDATKIANANAKVSIQLKKSSGESTIKGLNMVKIFIGGAFGYLIMMFIVIYGNMVMRSVIEEKTNRIIEIIISSVKPFQLMMGKIIGTSLAGILQFLIWASIGGTLFFVLSVLFHVQLGATSAIDPQMLAAQNPNVSSDMQLYFKEIWSLPKTTILGCFLIYFIGGYFLYSSFYAAIGAAVDSETDSQQFLLPIIMPLILAVYVGFFSVLNNPHGTIAIVFSMIPLTSPIVMMMRIPFGVPWWQILISITILFSTFFLVVWFASKIYRIGILMYGKKTTWKEIFKWLKY
jgi:ABC-2 type transport system permease protein